ncbi:MAG: hypothetical protein ACJAUP_002117 [Cellvibrionaceae bacterium]|jgi:hypothetical protein
MFLSKNSRPKLLTIAQDAAPTAVQKSTKSDSSMLNKAAHFFQGTDGWDELGSSLGQILPGVGQHIATLSFLSVLAPAVYLGIKGMATEYEEAHASINEAKLAKQALIDKIIEVFDLKIDPDIFESGAKSFKHFINTLEKHKESDPSIFEEKAKLLVEYSDALKHEKSTKIGYDAAPLGVYAMSSMFGGMISAVSTSAVEIAHSANPTTQGLELAATVGEAVTSGIFIPAQAVMVAYSLMKYSEGQSEKAIKQFDKSQVSEFKSAEPEVISHNFYGAIQDNLDRQITYIHREKIIYGAGLAASETGMMTGTALGLTPATSVGLGILAPSALSTIGFAGLRIHTTSQKGKFTGHPHDHLHNGNVANAIKKSTKHVWRRMTNTLRNSENKKPIPESKTDPDTCIHKYSSYKMSDAEYDNKTIEGQFNDATERLADYKKTSILLESLEGKKSIDDMMVSGRKSFFRRTTIQKDVLVKMKEFGLSGSSASCLKMRCLPEHQGNKYNVDLNDLDQDQLSQITKNKEEKISLLQALSLNIVLSDPTTLLKDLFAEDESALVDYNNALKGEGLNEQNKKRVLNKKYSAQFTKHLDNEHIFQALKPHIDRMLVTKHVSNKKLKKAQEKMVGRSVSPMRNIDVLTEICKSLVRDKKAEAKRDRQQSIDQMVFVAKHRNMMRQSKANSIIDTGQPSKEVSLNINPSSTFQNLFVPKVSGTTAVKNGSEESKVEIDSPRQHDINIPSFSSGFSSLLEMSNPGPKLLNTNDNAVDVDPKSTGVRVDTVGSGSNLPLEPSIDSGKLNPKDKSLTIETKGDQFASVRPGMQKIIDEARRIKEGEGTPTQDPRRLKARDRIKNDFQDFVDRAIKTGVGKA